MLKCPSVFLLLGLRSVLMFMKESMQSVAGAGVKKLTTTGTFHSQGAERNCQWQKGERRETEAKNKRAEEREGGGRCR